VFARPLAFGLLAVAAFDWPMPWLDRGGTALLGAACVVLLVGRVRRASPALPFLSPTRDLNIAPITTSTVPDDLAERIAAYDLEAR